MSSTTAGALRLNGGTFHGAKGTKHAAIAGTGFKHFAAAFAFIEELTRVRRHGLRACEIAFRAREHGFVHQVAHCHGSDPNQRRVLHLFYCFTVEGYPALAVASRNASTLVLASSKVTTASFVWKLAATFSTPLTFFNALLTVAGHISQYMPGTLSVTVLSFAYAGARTVSPNSPARARITELRFIVLS